MQRFKAHLLERIQHGHYIFAGEMHIDSSPGVVHHAVAQCESPDITEETPTPLVDNCDSNGETLALGNRAELTAISASIGLSKSAAIIARLSSLSNMIRRF